ncbi:MAG: hypothetical protein GOU97_00550 [Nanoarchaeota archaeon]|nr:hypothetical protein [Nanoarchaeota archaeon]
MPSATSDESVEEIKLLGEVYVSLDIDGKEVDDFKREVIGIVSPGVDSSDVKKINESSKKTKLKLGGGGMGTILKPVIQASSNAKETRVKVDFEFVDSRIDEEFDFELMQGTKKIDVLEVIIDKNKKEAKILVNGKQAKTKESDIKGNVSQEFSFNQRIIKDDKTITRGRNPGSIKLHITKMFPKTDEDGTAIIEKSKEEIEREISAKKTKQREEKEEISVALEKINSLILMFRKAPELELFKEVMNALTENTGQIPKEVLSQSNRQLTQILSAWLEKEQLGVAIQILDSLTNYNKLLIERKLDNQTVKTILGIRGGRITSWIPKLSKNEISLEQLSDIIIDYLLDSIASEQTGGEKIIAQTINNNFLNTAIEYVASNKTPENIGILMEHLGKIRFVPDFELDSKLVKDIENRLKALSGKEPVLIPPKPPAEIPMQAETGQDKLAETLNPEQIKKMLGKVSKQLKKLEKALGRVKKEKKAGALEKELFGEKKKDGSVKKLGFIEQLDLIEIDLLSAIRSLTPELNKRQVNKSEELLKKLLELNFDLAEHLLNFYKKTEESIKEYVKNNQIKKITFLTSRIPNMIDSRLTYLKKLLPSIQGLGNYHALLKKPEELEKLIEELFQRVKNLEKEFRTTRENLLDKLPKDFNQLVSAYTLLNDEFSRITTTIQELKGLSKKKKDVLKLFTQLNEEGITILTRILHVQVPDPQESLYPRFAEKNKEFIDQIVKQANWKKLKQILKTDKKTLEWLIQVLEQYNLPLDKIETKESRDYNQKKIEELKQLLETKDTGLISEEPSAEEPEAPPTTPTTPLALDFSKLNELLGYIAANLGELLNKNFLNYGFKPEPVEEAIKYANQIIETVEKYSPDKLKPKLQENYDNFVKSLTGVHDELLLLYSKEDKGQELFQLKELGFVLQDINNLKTTLFADQTVTQEKIDNIVVGLNNLFFHLDQFTNKLNEILLQPKTPEIPFKKEVKKIPPTPHKPELKLDELIEKIGEIVLMLENFLNIQTLKKQLVQDTMQKGKQAIKNIEEKAELKQTLISVQTFLTLLPINLRGAITGVPASKRDLEIKLAQLGERVQKTILLLTPNQESINKTVKQLEKGGPIQLTLSNILEILETISTETVMTTREPVPSLPTPSVNLSELQHPLKGIQASLITMERTKFFEDKLGVKKYLLEEPRKLVEATISILSSPPTRRYKTIITNLEKFKSRIRELKQWIKLWFKDEDFIELIKRWPKDKNFLEALEKQGVKEKFVEGVKGLESFAQTSFSGIDADQKRVKEVADALKKLDENLTKIGVSLQASELAPPPTPAEEPKAPTPLTSTEPTTGFPKLKQITPTLTTNHHWQNLKKSLEYTAQLLKLILEAKPAKEIQKTITRTLPAINDSIQAINKNDLETFKKSLKTLNEQILKLEKDLNPDQFPNRQEIKLIKEVLKKFEDSALENFEENRLQETTIIINTVLNQQLKILLHLIKPFLTRTQPSPTPTETILSSEPVTGFAPIKPDLKTEEYKNAFDQLQEILGETATFFEGMKTTNLSLNQIINQLKGNARNAQISIGLNVKEAGMPPENLVLLEQNLTGLIRTLSTSFVQSVQTTIGKVEQKSALTSLNPQNYAIQKLYNKGVLTPKLVRGIADTFKHQILYAITQIKEDLQKTVKEPEPKSYEDRIKRVKELIKEFRKQKKLATKFLTFQKILQELTILSGEAWPPELVGLELQKYLSKFEQLYKELNKQEGRVKKKGHLIKWAETMEEAASIRKLISELKAHSGRLPQEKYGGLKKRIDEIVQELKKIYQKKFGALPEELYERTEIGVAGAGTFWDYKKYFENLMKKFKEEKEITSKQKLLHQLIQILTKASGLVLGDPRQEDAIKEFNKMNSEFVKQAKKFVIKKVIKKGDWSNAELIIQELEKYTRTMTHEKLHAPREKNVELIQKLKEEYLKKFKKPFPETVHEPRPGETFSPEKTFSPEFRKIPKIGLNKPKNVDVAVENMKKLRPMTGLEEFFDPIEIIKTLTDFTQHPLREATTRQDWITIRNLTILLHATLKTFLDKTSKHVKNGFKDVIKDVNKEWDGRIIDNLYQTIIHDKFLTKMSKTETRKGREKRVLNETYYKKIEERFKKLGIRTKRLEKEIKKIDKQIKLAQEESKVNLDKKDLQELLTKIKEERTPSLKELIKIFNPHAEEELRAMTPDKLIVLHEEHDKKPTQNQTTYGFLATLARIHSFGFVFKKIIEKYKDKEIKKKKEFIKKIEKQFKKSVKKGKNLNKEEVLLHLKNFFRQKSGTIATNTTILLLSKIGGPKKDEAQDQLLKNVSNEEEFYKSLENHFKKSYEKIKGYTKKKKVEKGFGLGRTGLTCSDPHHRQELIWLLPRNFMAGKEHCSEGHPIGR